MPKANSGYERKKEAKQQASGVRKSIYCSDRKNELPKAPATGVSHRTDRNQTAGTSADEILKYVRRRFVSIEEALERGDMANSTRNEAYLCRTEFGGKYGKIIQF